MKRLYLAGALHTLNQRLFLEMFAEKLGAHYEVYLPHRDGGQFQTLVSEQGMPPPLAAQEVYSADVKAMEKCDLMVAVFVDGPADPGMAFEMGFMACAALPVYGLLPSNHFHNPMLMASMAGTFERIEDFLPIRPTYPTLSRVK